MSCKFCKASRRGIRKVLKSKWLKYSYGAVDLRPLIRSHLGLIETGSNPSRPKKRAR